ncbi:hypothetical protein BXO88_13275 [Oribacterium sp. C9]|nr:hypothetical protein BXO88_13275 [Oribacterium sp. C9]
MKVAVLFDKIGKGSVFVFAFYIVKKLKHEILLIGVFRHADVYSLEFTVTGTYFVEKFNF